MALLQITQYGNPILRKKAQQVSPEELDKDFIDSMLYTMRERDGVGLAAPQVDISKRVIVATDFEKDYVLLNPVITAVSEQMETDNEGCLSVAGFQAEVPRYERIYVQAQDVSGNDIEIKASGYFARVLQHEIDHLNGILYIDRAVPESLIAISGDDEGKYFSNSDLIQHFKKIHANTPDKLEFNRIEAL